MFTRLIIDPMTGTTAGEGTHPFLSLLSRLNINVSTGAEGLEDIKLSRNRIPNVHSVMRESERSKKYFPQGHKINPMSSAEPGPVGAMNMLGFDDSDIGKVFTMTTFDTETASLSGQQRAIALAQSKVKYLGKGQTEQIEAPRIVLNKQFTSPEMDIAHTYKDGVRMPLSEATLLDEAGSDTVLATARKAFDGDGQGYVDDMKEVLEQFIKSDRVGGHHAEVFDLDSMFQTLMKTKAFHTDSEMQRLYKEFVDKRMHNPSFFFDTHTSATRLFDVQKVTAREVLTNALGDVRPETIEQIISEHQLAPELLAKAKSTPQSMQNIMLNTNFLQLVENEAPEQTENLMNIVSQRGMHTADVDALLEDFLAKYIQNGKLQMQRLPTPGRPVGTITGEAATEYASKYGEARKALTEYGFIRKDRNMSNFENYMRRSAVRSGAVTPITNISGVDRVSNEVFQFLSETEAGQQRISLDVNSDILRNELGYLNTPEGVQLNGELSYNPKIKEFEFTNFGDNETQIIDKGKARQYIQKTLAESRDASATENIILGSTKAGDQISATVNTGQWRTNDIHFTNIQATKFDQMVDAKALASTITRTSEPLSAEALSLTAGLDKVTMTPAKYSEALIKKGLPYAEMDMQTRILAVENAKATAKLGKTILANSASKEAQKISTLLGTDGRVVSENMGLLSEMGLQFFSGQGKNKIFDKKYQDNSYFRLPTENQTANRASKVIMTSDDFTELTLNKIGARADQSIKIGSEEFIKSKFNNFYTSFVNNGEQSMVNQVFNPNMLGKESLDDLAEQVMTLQVKRYAAENTEGARVVNQAGVIKKDIVSLGKSIFGDHIDDTQQIEKLFSLDKAARLAHLEAYDRSSVAINSGVNSVRNYQNTVEQLGTTIREGGIVAYTNADQEVVQAMVSAAERHGGAATDAVAKTQSSQMVLSSEGGVGAVFSQAQDMVIKRGVTQVTEGLDEASAAEAAVEAVTSSNKDAFNRFGEVAQSLSEDSAFASSARRANTGATGGISAQEIKAGSEFIRKNKKALVIGATVSFAAYGIHKLSQRKKENDLYDRTIETLPVESGNRPYGIQEALMKGDQSSSRRDPLFTAGVVGNLDRSKIGHSMMGSNKNSHLFGG